MNWIVVAQHTSIALVATRGSDEMFRFRVKRYRIIEVDGLLGAGAVALGIINYRISITPPIMY